MRRRTALLYTLPLFPLLAAALAVACGGDDSGGVHGEVFGPDGSALGDGGKIGDGSFVEPDGRVITPGDGGDSGPACTTGTIAIVGGGASSSFASVSTGNGAFTTQNFASVGTAALPSLVAFGSGFQAVFHAAGSNVLMSTGYASPTWSAPAVIGGTLVREMPTLAVQGTTLQMVYQANDDAGPDTHKYFHGSYASNWTAGDPMGVGVDQSFGPHAPAASGNATDLVSGQVGSNKSLYVRHYASSAWGPSDMLDDAGATELGSVDANLGAAPRLVTMSGGTSDAMFVYTRDGDYKLMVFTSAAGVWSPGPIEIDANDYTSEAFNLAALPSGKAIVTWRGSNGFGYASLYSGTTWSTPATALTTFTINSAPAVAVGDCGSVAIAAYAKTAGTVETIRYDGTSWGAAQPVAGASGASFVAIAASP